MSNESVQLNKYLGLEMKELKSKKTCGSYFNKDWEKGGVLGANFCYLFAPRTSKCV